MIKQWIGRWRYANLCRYDTSMTPILDRLINTYLYILHLSFDTANYRDRVRYRVVTKTDYAMQLLEYTQRLQGLVEAHSPIIDRFEIAYRWPKQHNFDQYLQDHDQRPVYEPEIANQLIYHLAPIIDVLEGLRFDQNDIYRFYEQSLHYIALDWIEVMDVLCALQLEIPHERRNASPAHSRRSRRQ